MTSNTLSADIGTRIERVGNSVMEEVRSETLLSFRFLSPALYAMPFVRAHLESTMLAADGTVLLFDPVKVVQAFRKDPNELKWGPCMLSHGLPCHRR